MGSRLGGVARSSLISAIWVIIVLSPPVFSQSEYRIAVNKGYGDVAGSKAVNQFFKRMYAPLGINPRVQFFPSKRGLQLANAGKVDAESGRVLKVASTYTNLIPVPEPMINHVAYYFCLSAEGCAKGVDGAYGLISGFHLGLAFCDEQQLTCLSNQSPSFLAKALSSGAIDAILGGKANTLSALCDNGISKVYRREEKALEVVSYHLIHKRHAELVDALATSIRNMRANGFIAAFVENTTALSSDCDIEIIEL